MEILKDEELSKEVSKPVTEITKEVKDFCINLCVAMRTNNGIGIAAPQVGRLERIIVIDSTTFGSSGHFCTIMINPEIIHSSGHKHTNEGCLSFPGRKIKTRRAKSVEVKYQDTQGNTHTCSFHGLAAVVIQHEVDHLDGITMFDKDGYKL